MESRILLAVLGTLVIACDSANVPVAPSSATNDAAIRGDGNGAIYQYTGQGTAIDATVRGVNTKFCDAGPLPRLGGRVEHREESATLPGVLAATKLHCETLNKNNKAVAEAELGRGSDRPMVVSVGGNTILADRVTSMSRAECPPNGPTSNGHASVLNLIVNGKAIWIRGTQNQKVDLPNGYVLINEQSSFVTRWHSGRTVTGLRVVINKSEPTADIAIARALAHIDCP